VKNILHVLSLFKNLLKYLKQWYNKEKYYFLWKDTMDIRQPAYTLQKWFIFVRSLYHSPVIKDFLTYSCGAIVLRAITLFLAPLILRTISPEEYGVLALVNSCIAIVAPIIGLGLRQVLMLEYFHCAGNNRQQLVNDIIITYLCCCVPLCTLLYVMRVPLQHYFLHAPLHEYLVGLALAQMSIYFFVELVYQLLGYERKVRLLIGLQMSVALITIGCSLLFVLKLQRGIIGILAGQCVGSSVAVGVGIYCYVVGKYHKALLCTASIKKMIYYMKYGIPFIPGMIFAWLLASGNRWFLARYGTLHDVGIYAIADTFVQLFQVLVLLPWSASYLPYILTSYTQNPDALLAVERRNQMWMYGAMVSFALMIVCAYVSCTPLLMWLLPVTYHPAIDYIWPLLMGYVFLLGSNFASSFIQFHKKNCFLAFAFCIPVGTNGMLNCILIPRFGLYGCATATCISYAVYFGIVLGYNYRLQKEILSGRV
jgi:O-antigen/teichoic acid export membrane protein